MMFRDRPLLRVLLLDIGGRLESDGRYPYHSYIRISCIHISHIQIISYDYVNIVSYIHVITLFISYIIHIVFPCHFISHIQFIHIYISYILTCPPHIIYHISHIKYPYIIAHTKHAYYPISLPPYHITHIHISYHINIMHNK